MLDYYTIMKEYNISVIYNGSLWSEGIEGYAETLKRRLAFDNLPMGASHAVFAVFIEQMNNMLMYSEEREAHGRLGDEEKKIPKGLFLLGESDVDYFLQSGNVIKSANVARMKERIDFLNSLDRVQLKSYYIEQLKSVNTNPESKGAGLGLIEIAKRASAPIEYSFIPFSDGLQFFTMLVKLRKGKE